MRCLCIRFSIVFVPKRTSNEKTEMKNTAHNGLQFGKSEAFELILNFGAF